VLPYRFAHLAEPLIGGLLDHAMGEVRRMRSPHLAGGSHQPPPEDS